MIEVNFLKIFQPYFCEDIIRLGKDYDGGYLVNKQDILKSKKIISLGVDNDFSFEKDFTSINDCDVVAYDGNPNLNFDGLKEYYKDNKSFVNKNIGNKKNEVPFSSIIGEENVFLKCDIEGNEYNILNDIIIHSKLFTGIVIEFHDMNGKNHFNDVLNFISKIDQKLIHTHVNNYFYYKTPEGCVPDIIELTFSSSNNINFDADIKLPHKLDMPNNPNEYEFKINF